MGLDNGITVKNVTRKQLPPFIIYPFEVDFNDNVVDICYWRKWWGLRNDIVNLIHMDFETYDKRLTCADVADISKLIWSYLISNDIEELDHGYWEEESVRRTARINLWNLFWLRVYMRLHPNAEVYFYDSY